MDFGKKTHLQKLRETYLIICHNEVPYAVLTKSRTQTPDHLFIGINPFASKKYVRNYND